MSGGGEEHAAPIPPLSLARPSSLPLTLTLSCHCSASPRIPASDASSTSLFPSRWRNRQQGRHRICSDRRKNTMLIVIYLRKRPNSFFSRSA